MTRQFPAPPAIAPAEARYFELMAIGPDDSTEASAPPLDPLAAARRHQLTAISILDDEPDPARVDLVA